MDQAQAESGIRPPTDPQIPQIRRAALNLLARREHARQELANRLNVRFDRALVAQVLDNLAAEGLQSDARFLTRFIAAKIQRGQGPLKIAHALRTKGIPQSAIQEALHPHAADWPDHARQAAQRKFGNTPPPTFQARQKRQRFLATRGFPTELCHHLFRQ
ncbi:MAG: regulatory protein RecX [Cellvibrionales bacterium]|nr:regulatory protein RecX [Cellvibrionales bacterium]